MRSSSIPAVTCARLVLLVCCLAMCVPFGGRQARGQVGMDQKNIFALLVTMLLALCSSLLLSSPRCWASWPVCLEDYRNTWFFWEMTADVSVFGLVRLWIHFYVSLLRPGLSCRGAEVDSHGLAVQHTMVSPQLQSIIMAVIFHFEAQRLFPMVRQGRGLCPQGHGSHN